MGKPQHKNFLHQAVLEEQLAHLSQMGGPAYLSNIIIALVITYVYWQREPLLASTLSLVVLAIVGLHYLFFFRYKKITPHQRDPWYWSRLYYQGSFLSGITWGIGLAMFANYLGGIDFFVILAAVIIVSATGFISFSSHLMSLYLFFYPLMIPITLICYHYYNIPLMLASALMLTIYMIMAGILSYKNYKVFVRSVIYRQRHLLLKKKLQDSNLELRNVNQQLSSLSATDSLTGIANRRYFDEVFHREFQQAAREGSPLIIILIDIDHFKAYNDNYGHVEGDKVLVNVAQTLNDSLTRPIDLVARYGGEEFIVVLPCTDMAGAINIAERIQANVRALTLTHDYSPLQDKVLTISMGISQYKPHADRTPDNLIERADQALYRAKAAGRNGYIIAS